LSAQFVHLRLHTEYSLVDSVVRMPALMDEVTAANMPAVGLTDQSNLFATVKFYQAAVAKGIKPIIGVDAWIAEDSEESQPARLTLLCQNATGYRHLLRLVTRSFLEGERRGVPVIRRGWLESGNSDGLIALSGGVEGDVGRALLAGREDEAARTLQGWQALFPDRYYLELYRTGRGAEEDYLHSAVSLASAQSAPLVATNDVRFLRPDDFEAHEARVCIHDGYTLADPSRPRRYSEQQFLRSPAQMAELFSDLPEALENTVEIARRCTLELALGQTYLPDFPVPEGMDAESFLRQRSAAGLAEHEGGQADTDAYKERLASELNVICRMGFAGYFLIVADFIRWSEEHDIPVGPGRGSGAGSLVAYALGITKLDPIEHDLLFERFLNPERISMPDFDVDFCMEGRDRVIDYVASRFGKDSVSQIITYGSMAAKAVVRDVGRVLGHPYGYVDRIAKLIPFELGMTLDKALTQDDELKTLYKNEEEVRTLIDLARNLEGLVRNAGKHAGGVVIAPTVLSEFTPLYREEGGDAVVTQFDKDDVEAVGLVKFDFLGLRTLTIIDRTVKIINAAKVKDDALLQIDRIPLDDAKTYALLRRCATTAVFQLESRGMKDLVRRLQPDHFDDLVALVALFRPGPLQSGMVDDFISRKHGRNEAPINYLHPTLKSILEPTYGVILYQEQVMQIAQVLAGYSLGEADILRRAMGKKKPEEMAKQRSVFVDGAKKKDVKDATSSYIFDLMEKFAGYGFNKSHSAAYALLSYQTAWLKAHHPAAFMSAVLSADMDNTDKIVMLIDECARLGLQVNPPDINESQHAFSVAGEEVIRYGLGAIKGVGQSAVDSLIDERQANGVFEDLDQLCRRVDMHKANRRVLEALIKAGALDRLGPNRATLMDRLPRSIRLAEQSARASEAGQNDLFGLVSVPAPAPREGERPALEEWSDNIRLNGERETLGLYLTGHPIEAFERDLEFLTHGRISELMGPRPAGNGQSKPWEAPKRVVIVAGLVVELRRRGNRLSLILDDRTGRLEVTVFDDVYQQYRHILAKDAILVIEGGLRYDDFIDDWRVTAREIMEIDKAREQHARRIVINWSGESNGREFISALQEVLKPHTRGSCGVSVNYAGASARARLSLGEEWTVRPTRELMEQLGKLVGKEGVQVVYPPRV